MAEKQEFREIVRVIDKDIPGKVKISSALRRVSGVGFSFANALCQQLGIDGNKQVGDFSEEEIKAIEKVIRNPTELPS